MSRSGFLGRLKERLGAGEPAGREGAAWLRSLQGRGMKLDLENMNALLGRLDDPHEHAPAIHVAGTNGKGSTVAVTASILQAAGHRVGTYTSPHLVTFRERIRVDGAVIPPESVDAGVEALRPVVEEVEAASGNVVTYFEAMTALAYWWFRERDVDVAVVEVGLGGRLDATNVLDAPLVTAVTNVSREHVDVLGTDVAAIGREKAAIARKGVPLVTAATSPAIEAITEHAEGLGAPLLVHGRDFSGESVEATPRGQEVLIITHRRDLGIQETRLLGAHQATNVALAATLCDAADERGLTVPEEAYGAGIRDAWLPGRLHWMKSAPPVLLDSAHNPAAAQTLATYLRDEELKVTAVFGCLDRKEWVPMVEAIAPHCDGAVVTRPPSDDAAEPQGPGRAFSRAGVFATVVEDPAHALATARAQAGEDGVVLVTGSFYLVGHALRLLGWQPDQEPT